MTVLQRLVQYQQANLDAPLYYRIRNVPWVLDIVSNGRADLRPWNRRGPVPVMRRSGTRPMPFLAVDTAEYILGVGGHTERTKAFWDQMFAWAVSPNTHPAVAALLLLVHDAEVHGSTAPEPRDRIAIRVAGYFLHQLDEAVTEWARIIEARKGAGTGMCSVCGQQQRLAASLPNAIATPVSNTRQQPLLTVPLRAQTDGLPLCLECGDRASAAIDQLANDPGHHYGDTYVFSPVPATHTRIGNLLQLLHQPAPGT
ncbi:type I-C CRISPR-associated protein Cas8c/Csd1 [Phytomonospora sp. NPDC050363]|uniref:type I-C CRISPR-associated protein Cas8c/Csd1 n=1 Tax=Phytomonospora sp. NPDC050363 TaxID=3155642 RepID=UPI0033D9ECD1